MIGTMTLVAERLVHADPNAPEKTVEAIAAALFVGVDPIKIATLVFAALRALPDEMHEQIMEAVLRSHLGGPPIPVFLDTVQEANGWACLLKESGKRIFIAALWTNMCARERNAFLVWASTQKSRVPT